MRNRVYSFVVLLLLLALSSSAFAQSPQISNGLSWLYSAQTTTGNWPQVVTTDYYSTAAAMDAVFSLDPSNPAYSTAFQWLSTQLVSPTDYLSRQIIALSRGGHDTSGYITSLLLYRNADGGFGGADNCPNSYILDTALALQALSSVNYSDTTLIGQSLNYLTSNQNPDGGWGFTAGDTSNTYVTSIVLRSLSVYNSVFINQNSINQASSFLLAHQNSDGGFGNSPSTIYDTAMSLMSLIESGQGSTQTILSGINYLATTQAADGSWNDDPYSTALALQALAEARPNLAVSSSGITFSNSMPQSGVTTTISAVISNKGYDNASNVIVRFYLGDPLAGGTQIGTDQIIPFIALGSSAQATIIASFTGTGGKTIFVVADPDNLISETSKLDNKASARVWVATGVDLAVYSEDLKPSTSVPTAGTAFTLSYTVRNLGESPVGAFAVSLYDGDPNNGGTLLQTANISGMNGSDMRAGTLGVTLTTNGNHTLYLMADSGSTIQEISETNNIGTVTVNVGGTQTLADLAISPQDITLTPSRPHAGDTVTISANVHNIGADVANNFTVEIFDGAPEAGGTLIASQTMSLVAGGTQTVTANWLIPAGIHDVYVVLDRANTVIETNENNNRASVRVMTDMVDIVITATDLVFTPSHPVNGDSVVLSIAAHNTGIKDTGPFNLALYDGDPNNGGTLLQTFAIANISSDGTNTVSYAFTAIPWTYRFYAIADTENVVPEMYEDNNTAIRALTIKSPGETLGPDLIPTKVDLTDTTTDSQTLAISGTAHITFQNKGDAKITTPFNVSIFEDKDGDGKYTAGVDNLLSTATNTQPLWPEGAGMIDLPLSGTVTFLHSPLYAFVDSSDVVLEQDETNNVLVSCKDCQVVPANPIQPVVKWTYNKLDQHQNWTPPVVAPLIDTNGDGKIDENDVPVILYSEAPEMPSASQHIVALRGDTGQTLFSIGDSSPVLDAEYKVIAVGDVDGDGHNEIIAIKNSSLYGPGLLAYDDTGKLKWDNSAIVAAYNASHRNNYITTSSGMLEIADIDGDGKPEIIDGSTVYNGDGTIKWNYFYGQDFYYIGVVRDMSAVADLDLDGKQEIVARNLALNADGTIKWWNNGIPNGGLDFIANFNDDPYPEILYATRYGSSNSLYLLDHTGKVLWGPVSVQSLEPTRPIISTPDGSVPVIADFDGDGQAEIGIKGITKFFILDRNGHLKQTLPIPSMSCPAENIAPTVFDLDGDGVPEVIFDAGGYFQIFNGKNGTLLYRDAATPCSLTNHDNYQRTIVADVDGDGHAEVVMVDWPKTFANGYPNPTSDKVRVYGAKNNDWVGSRKIWNQANYHITNVNDDGSIPQYESPSWLLNNTYGCQEAVAPSTNPYLTPNLTASYMRIEQSGSALNIAARIGNGGAIATGPSVTVTYYDGDPAAGGTVIGTATTTKSLNPGDYQDVVYSWAGGSLGLHHIYAVVDAANTISECRKDDNQTNLDVTIVVEYPDLKIGPENIVLPAGPYYEGTPIPVTVGVSNIGGLAASNVAVRLYNGNPASGGVQVGADQVVPLISAGGSASVTFIYDTLGKTETNVLYFVVDPANTIVETTKANNSASVMFVVQQAVLPDLAVSAADIQLTPATPREGDRTTITATIHNLGTAVGNIPVKITVARVMGQGGGEEVYSETKTIYPSVALGQTALVQTVVDTTGLSGQLNVVVTVDPGNSIAESREDNNSANQAFFIQSAGLIASVATDTTSYQADSVVTATITASDITGSSRSLTLGLYVQDSAGNRIATISAADPVTIGANSSVTLSRTWNTGTSLSGQYTIISELSESGTVISRKSAAFTITSDTSMNATVTTDKISYNPNETATLTAVITSQSRNNIFGNLSATLTIGSNTITTPSTTVFTDTKALSTLMPGATFTFKDYWNISTNPSGTYPVTLTVKDSTGAVMATGTQTLTITSTIKPTSVLRGQITVGTQELLSGQTATVSYNVTNVGNIDLQNMTLTVLVVSASDQTMYDTFPYPTTLAMGGTASNTVLIDTTKYTAKDYLVVLRANINGTEATLSGTYFRIEGAPSAPSLAGPAMGSDVLTFTPLLSVNNASDPNNDKLTYQFELYTDSGLTNLIGTSGLFSEGTGTTSWQIPIPLQENAVYYWRARAYDNWLYGPWMSTASFRVNTVDDPPTAPLISSPADGSQVATYTPILVVTNATDPDSPSLTYNFDVALDPGFTQIVATTTGVLSSQTGSTGSPQAGTGGTTSWQVPTNLTEDTTYYWRAQADDWLMTGPWSTTATFFVNTTNEPPTIPVIQVPADGSTIAALETDVTITNSTDPDSPVITYFFEVDTATTFDSPNIIRSGGIAPGQGTTTWHVTGLAEDTQYYVRVKASDGQADSAWSGTVGFFANAVNEAPTTPILANPSSGSGVNVFTPTLSVHDATDPDRDILTYDFEVYSDSGLTTLVTSTTGVPETSQITSWTVPMALTENQTYYWRSRAFDSKLYSPWMPQASFMVNTANDAPGAPTISAPAEGSTVTTLTPILAVVNATDPDSPSLTYDFEVYLNSALVTTVSGVPGDSSGITSVTITKNLTDNTLYQWRARAFDGQLYGPWTSMANFAVHLPQTGITAEIELEPETLNKESEGKWVMVKIELPHGYSARDIDISSIRLEGTVHAEPRPYEIKGRNHDHGCEHDHRRHDHSELTVKFKRDDVIAVLPVGDHVPVHVTGMIGSTSFGGVDIIRVVSEGH